MSVARAIFQNNTIALKVDLAFPELEYVTARDGSLTAKRDGCWLAGCSVPQRASELVLRSLVHRSGTACLLAPTHAQQIVACLNISASNAGVIVLLSDASLLPELLCLHDFSENVVAGRLRFCDGMDALEALFDHEHGLTVPTQFVRTHLGDITAADVLIAPAQHIFSRVAARHTQRIAAASQLSVTTNDTRIVLTAPLHFRLWDDVHDIITLIDATIIDLDNPTQSAPAFLAEQAAAHSAFVTVNTARAAWPTLLNASKPWITLLTQSIKSDNEIPQFVHTSPRDGLMIFDPLHKDLARRAGWPDARVMLVSTPQRTVRATVRHTGPVTIIADLPDTTPPESIKDMSSHRLVWEQALHELSRNPFALGQSARNYLDKLLTSRDIRGEFPRDVLIDRIICGAYAIGLAHWAIEQQLPVAIYGNGWTNVPALESVLRGRITTRQAFGDAIDAASVLLNPFVAHTSHSISAVAARYGVPMIRPLNMTASRTLNDIAAARNGRAAPATPTAPALTTALLRQFAGLSDAG